MATMLMMQGVHPGPMLLRAHQRRSTQRYTCAWPCQDGVRGLHLQRRQCEPFKEGAGRICLRVVSSDGKPWTPWRMKRHTRMPCRRLCDTRGELEGTS